MKKTILSTLALVLCTGMMTACRGAKTAADASGSPAQEPVPVVISPIENEDQDSEPIEPDESMFVFEGYYSDPDPDVHNSLRITAEDGGYAVVLDLINAGRLSGYGTRDGSRFTAVLGNGSTDRPVTVEIAPMGGNGGFVTASVTDSDREDLPAGEAFTFAPGLAPEELQGSGFDGDRFVGEWSDEYSQRAFLRVVPTDYFGEYSILIHWGNSADSFAEWNMTASYDGDSGSIRYTDGSCSDVTLHENADEKRDIIWEGSEGRFFFEGDTLRWEDNREESDADMVFVKDTTPAPSPAELTEQYFRPIAQIPDGTAGVTLKEAQVACEALRFADTYAVWCNDTDELQENLAEAWKGLTGEEQAAFGDHLFAIHGLVVNSTVNWTDYGWSFEDAGVGEEMQTLEADRTALEGFYRLFDSTVETCFAEG